MARKPPNVSWVGFTHKQVKLLDAIDALGDNGWARDSRTDALMPKVLAEAERLDLSLERVKKAMRSIGYDTHAVHQLDRWESQRPL
jgi:hypothetical protein